MTDPQDAPSAPPEDVAAPPAAPADEQQQLRDALDRAAEGIAGRVAEAETAARAHVGSGTPAAGRLGRLAEWQIWLSGIQGGYPPQALARVRLLVVGSGLAPGHDTHRLLESTGATMEVIALQPNCGSAEAAQVGIAAVDQAVDAGCDLLMITAALDDSLSGTLVALLLRLSATEVVGESAHLDDAAWADLVGAIRDRAHEVRRHEDDHVAALDALGSAPLTALTAMALRAAARRTPVLLDGAADAAAALCASRHAALAAWWWLAASVTNDPATSRAIDALGLEPLTALGCHLDGGAAALTALPLLRAAQLIS